MKRWIQIALLALVAALLLLGLTWQNFLYARANYGGIDFLTHWIAARSFWHGISPYSSESATAVHLLFYGRPAVQGENAFYVLYPIYYIIFVLPFGLVGDALLARSLWMTFAEILLIALALFSASAARWTVPIRTLPLYLLFSLFWYHGLRTLVNGNLVILVAVALAVMAWAVVTKRDWLAGVALVFVTIKPNLGLLPVLWVLAWAISTRRWKIVLGFGVALLAGVLAGLAFFPTWLVDMVHLMTVYTGYNPPTDPGMVIDLAWPGAGHWVGLVISLAVGSLLLWEGIRSLRGQGSGFLWVLCLTIVLSQWSGITTDPGNFIVLFLPLALVLKGMADRPSGKWAVPLTLLLVFAGLWAFFLLTVQYDAMNQPVQSPWLFFPLPLLLLAGLYLTRRIATSLVS